MTQTICALCREPASTRCGRCRSAYYCSTNCQQKDFPLHKFLCKKRMEFMEANPRPSDLHYLGLLFPEKSNLPELVWVEAMDDREMDNEGNVIEGSWHCIAGVLPYMSGSNGWPQFPRPNPHNIEIYVTDDLGEHNEGNQCLAHLTKGYATRDVSISSIMQHDWNGPRVVVGFTERNEDGEVMNYRDVTLTDLRAALDDVSKKLNIFESDEPQAPNVFLHGKEENWVKAVKVSCSGDIKFLGKAKYRQVWIRKDHPVFFHQDDTSTISQYMGFTLIAKKCNFDPAWVSKANSIPSFNPFSNPEALQILINADPSDSKWEWWGKVIFPKWDNGQDPTVLFARKDRNDVTIYQIEALSAYCQNVVWMNMSDEDGEEEKMAVVKEFVRAEAFSEYFAEYCHERRDLGGKGWAEAEPPAPENEQGGVSDYDRVRDLALSLCGWDINDRGFDAVEKEEESDETTKSGGMELDGSEEEEEGHETTEPRSKPGSLKRKRNVS